MLFKVDMNYETWKEQTGQAIVRDQDKKRERDEREREKEKRKGACLTRGVNSTH